MIALCVEVATGGDRSPLVTEQDGRLYPLAVGGMCLQWASRLAECRITFEAREERTGQPGVKLEHPGGFIVTGPQSVTAESSGDPKELKAVDK